MIFHDEIIRRSSKRSEVRFRCPARGVHEANENVHGVRADRYVLVLWFQGLGFWSIVEDVASTAIRGGTLGQFLDSV